MRRVKISITDVMRGPEITAGSIWHNLANIGREAPNILLTKTAKKRDDAMTRERMKYAYCLFPPTSEINLSKVSLTLMMDVLSSTMVHPKAIRKMTIPVRKPANDSFNRTLKSSQVFISPVARALVTIDVV